MFESIVKQIESGFHPNKILLFGSYAKGVHHKDSDVDLCVVMETEDKRETLSNMYCDIKANLPIDFILYTPLEWDECVQDPYSLASYISKEGVVLYS